MQQNTKEHLLEILKEFDNAMLVTENDKGHLRGRPMAMAEIQADGEIYFATRLDSPKAREIMHDAHVNVTMQSSNKWVSISGIAELVQNREKIDEVWTEAWRAWFKGGKDDPELALIRLKGIEAEYWDQSGTNKIRFLLETAMAYASRTKTPGYDDHQHAKVSL